MKTKIESKNRRRPDDDFMHSISSASALRNCAPHWKQLLEASNCSSRRTAVKNFVMVDKDQEQCDWFSTKRKIWCTNPSYQRKEIWMLIRYDCWAVVFCRLPLRVLVCWCVSCFPWPVLSSSWLLVSLGDVAPNPRILVFEFVGIQHSISLCDISFFSSPRPLRTRCITNCPYSGFVHTLPREQASTAQQILFCGVMTPSLLLVRPGFHWKDVGLFWVCHCHCHCQWWLRVPPSRSTLYNALVLRLNKFDHSHDKLYGYTANKNKHRELYRVYDERLLEPWGKVFSEERVRTTSVNVLSRILMGGSSTHKGQNKTLHDQIRSGHTNGPDFALNKHKSRLRDMRRFIRGYGTKQGFLFHS